MNKPEPIHVAMARSSILFWEEDWRRRDLGDIPTQVMLARRGGRLQRELQWRLGLWHLFQSLRMLAVYE